MAILTRVTLAAALLLAGSGCRRSPTMFELTERSIAVHAVLGAGSDSATVLLTRPLGPNEWNSTGTMPVTNAQVRLVHDSDTVLLAGTSPCRWTTYDEPPTTTTGCYTAQVTGGVRAGATYELLVNIPGEEPIHGSTRVPFPPVILVPAASAPPPVLRMRHRTLPPTLLTARWSGADADMRTEVRFALDRDDCFAFIARPDRHIGSGHIAVTGVDTATVTAVAGHCGPPDADSYTARFVVTVYDRSYTRYRERLGLSTHPSRTSVGLTGAFGVFGAAATSATPVVLTLQ